MVYIEDVLTVLVSELGCLKPIAAVIHNDLIRLGKFQ